MYDPLHRDREPARDLRALERLVSSDALSASRRRVFRQLVEALLFEGIVRFEGTPRREDSEFHIPAVDEHGRAVSYVCRGRLRPSFGRVRLTDAPVQRVENGCAQEAQSIASFLVETQANHRADPERLSQFITELEHTIVKDAQAACAAQDLADARHGSYEELESAVGSGHPYHPSFKSRIGFDLTDNAEYGPEFAPTLRPVWVACSLAVTGRAASGRLAIDAFLRDEIGPSVWELWRGRIRDAGADPNAYALIPVHPWQWREQVLPTLYDDLRTGHIIALGPSPDAYRPQQSIRTLANVSAPNKASLKHSLSIINTSTSRILAPHTVLNAPLVSDWLSGLASADPFLRDELRPILLREVLGAAYDPHEPSSVRVSTYGTLSCIWRESVHVHLQAGERAVPWAALSWLDRDGRPFVEPWLRSGGERWLDRVLEVAILPVVHLLVAHGIALESHAQNMLLIHRDGQPTRVVLKDFHDGVRFSPAHLAAPAQAPRLHATPARHVRINRNSYLATDDPAAVRDFMLDALFFINLGEFAMFLSDHLGVPEHDFWSRVQTILAAYARRFGHLAARFELFDLAPDAIEVEKLANRRLFSETDVQTHRVRPPWLNTRASG